uniref:HIRAN domain-containing protein n=1 Tax=Ananas comosus var. bracteatus TaxID=296719 RepID=A0A6V7PSD7_ANACO|nr:unnamed protein product [Ananas comosus var. bracteatus]
MPTSPAPPRVPICAVPLAHLPLLMPRQLRQTRAESCRPPARPARADHADRGEARSPPGPARAARPAPGTDGGPLALTAPIAGRLAVPSLVRPRQTRAEACRSRRSRTSRADRWEGCWLAHARPAPNAPSRRSRTARAECAERAEGCRTIFDKITILSFFFHPLPPLPLPPPTISQNPKPSLSLTLSPLIHGDFFLRGGGGGRWPRRLRQGGGEEEEEEEPYLVGFVVANIVGLRYYTGRVSGRELVVLVREPLKPYDSNAIKVLNTRSAQVGHLERAAAKALARSSTPASSPPPTPSSPQSPQPLPLPPPLPDPPLRPPRRRRPRPRRRLRRRTPSRRPLRPRVPALRSRRRRRGGTRNVDEIFALVGKVDAAADPMEPPREVVVTELFEHQKVGLGFLVRRENSRDLPPFWEAADSRGFRNVLTNYETQDRPEPLRGGIFADDMGLGKTLTLLSLIALLRWRKQGLGKKAGNSRKRRNLDDGGRGENDEEGSLSSNTTLVVCPPSVFSSWISQLEEHTKPGSLKVYMYHGERTRVKEELMKYDIVFHDV